MGGGTLVTGIGSEQPMQLGAVGADATVKVGGLEGVQGDRERFCGSCPRDRPKRAAPRARRGVRISSTLRESARRGARSAGLASQRG